MSDIHDRLDHVENQLRDLFEKIDGDAEKAADAPKPAPKKPPQKTPKKAGPLMQGITMQNGYRLDFIEFMKANLIEPRPNAFDKIYEWARGNEANRKGMRGCRCMQNFLRSLDSSFAWVDMLIKQRAGGDAVAVSILNKEKSAKCVGHDQHQVVRVEEKYGVVLNRWRKALGMTLSESGYPCPALVSDRQEKEKVKEKEQQKKERIDPPMPKGIEKAAIIKAVGKGIRKVPHNQVVDALQDAGLGQLRPVFLDKDYYALPLETWAEIIEWSDVDRIKYVAEKRDCDNFAVAFAGQVGLRFAVNGVGIVVDFSGKHAYNCLLVTGDKDGDGVDDLSVVLLEPQSDRMPQVGDTMSGHEAYKAESGFILFA